MSDDRDSSTVDDILIPSDTEGTPLIWDGNYAKIPGLMNETNKHCVLWRPGLGLRDDRGRKCPAVRVKTPVPSAGF